MGGARIDKNQVRQVVSSQPRTFTMEDIAREASISIASAYTIVNDLIAEGKVVLDHKVGKRKHFTVSQSGSGETVVHNITLLPPTERFEYVGMMVDMVAMGISPSVLITGLSGIGKSFIVRSRLEENGFVEGQDYLKISGHSTPMGLYTLLHDHRDQCLVFDDCDSIFKEESSVNILKAALDSYDVRTVCWQSTRLPDELDPSFEFKGQIIFVSNLTADRFDEPTKSRTFVIDLQMSRKEICEHMRNILPSLEPKLNMGIKSEVIDELEIRCDSFEQFNIRTFIKACRVYTVANKNQKDWKKMLTVLI